ncbi:MAG: hypothetical protein WKG07_44610 [Hymenobacter sp.]
MGTAYKLEEYFEVFAGDFGAQLAFCTFKNAWPASLSVVAQLVWK